MMASGMAASIMQRRLVHLNDLGQRAWRLASHAIQETWTDSHHAWAARWALLNGHSETALEEHAWRIRHIGQAREALHPYAQIRDLLDKQPGRWPIVMPETPPRYMVFFLGYPRSGHSLVGSLLDAHPDVVIAHELHALRHLAQGASLASLTEAIVINSFVFHMLGRAYTGYDYQVAGQWQGRYHELLAAGDKKGNGSIRVLRRHPHLLDDLAACDRLRLIHVIRNPYDNIATKARRTGTSLEHAAQGYFSNVMVIGALKKRYGSLILDVHLEDLLAEPHQTLRTLLHHIQLGEPEPAYYAACSAILFATPHRSALETPWPAPLLRHIDNQLASVDFLQRYRGTMACNPG